jgi:hypothetical protein
MGQTNRPRLNERVCSGVGGRIPLAPATAAVTAQMGAGRAAAVPVTWMHPDDDRRRGEHGGCDDHRAGAMGAGPGGGATTHADNPNKQTEPNTTDKMARFMRCSPGRRDSSGGEWDTIIQKDLPSHGDRARRPGWSMLRRAR